MDKNVKKELHTDYSAVSICHACLSTDRALTVVSEYIDIFYRICDQDMVHPTVTHLCWECMALLKKVKMFSKNVSQAQKILQHCLLSKWNTFPLSLSRLKTCQIETNPETLSHEEIEFKPIKEEIDDHFDNFEYFSNDNVKEEIENTELPKLDDNVKESEEIENTVLPKLDDNVKESKGKSKVELDIKKIDRILQVKTKKHTLKINEKRKAKYRFVNTDLRKHRSYLIRTVVVDASEVLPELEAERSNNEFLKAEHKCVDCVEQFSGEVGFMKHFKKHHDEALGSAVCSVCRSRFPSTAALLAHSPTHNVKRQCRVCGEESIAPSAMTRHVKLHHRIVQCISCGLFFKNVRLFYSHYKSLHGRYICDVCGKNCKTRDVIERHLRYHFGYSCPYCKKVLKNSSSYKNHIECQHTNPYSDDAYCVPCDRRFKNVRLYKRHLMDSSAHAKEREYNSHKRKFPCPECSNVYTRRAFMNNHYRHVHSKQSKYYCEDCDRQFLNRTRYLDHRRFKHEGLQKDKDKLCNICGRGFAANRTLINHIRTHSGERPFGCEYCGAKFTQKHAMLSHVKFVHLKNKRKPSWQE